MSEKGSYFPPEHIARAMVHLWFSHPDNARQQLNKVSTQDLQQLVGVTRQMQVMTAFVIAQRQAQQELVDAIPTECGEDQEPHPPDDATDTMG